MKPIPPFCVFIRAFTIFLLFLPSWNSQECRRPSYISFNEKTTNIAENKFDVNSTHILTNTSLLHCAFTCSLNSSALSYYFHKLTGNCSCSHRLNSDITSGLSDELGDFTYGEITIDEGRIKWAKTITDGHGAPLKDCKAIFESGAQEDGVYTISPDNRNVVAAWCDMQVGGWTVFQKRINGSVEFYRGWKSYVEGFGCPHREHWLGLETIHELTKEPSELHIYMEAFPDYDGQETGYAHYSSFSLDDAAEYYRLHVGGFSGDVHDSMVLHNNRYFATYDSDNSTGTTCAQQFKGAWWYAQCHWSHLNGQYLRGYHPDIYASGIHWLQPWGHNYSLKTTTMKMRRL